MGTNSSKENMIHILENSAPVNKNKYVKIEYKFNYNEEPKDIDVLADDEKEEQENSDDSFHFFDDEPIESVNNPNLNVKNIKKFPYCAIGTISVQFYLSDEVFEYTCFLINPNVVVTLASNLNDINKGGKAKSIVTSFREENVKWENIFIQEEEKPKKQITEKNIPNKNLDKIPSKLAVILYNDYIKDEWLGVEGGKKEDFEERDIYAVFSYKGKKKNNNNNNNNNKVTFDEEKKINQQKFKEIYVGYKNLFLDTNIRGDKKELELIKQSPGSPLYYKDYNNGAYVIAIITDSFEFKYFDKKTMIFLEDMVQKGKTFRKKKIKLLMKIILFN